MSIPIQLKRGTRAQVDALAASGGLLVGEPLFITDTRQFAVAYSTNSYEVINPLRPAFSASHTASVTYSAGVALAYNTVAFDTMGNYSTVTSRFTATVAGFYLFNAKFTPLNTNATGDYRIALYKNGNPSNGSEILFYKSTTSVFETLSTNNIIQLAVGDYVTANWTQAPAGATSYGGTNAQWYNNFSGFQVA